MAIGMSASMIMVQNWEGAFILATTRKLAKINAWTSSKLANLTALARYSVDTFYKPYYSFRKTALLAVLVMIILVQRQQQLQS